MNWNYRVFEKDGIYTIRETIYRENKIVAWTEDAIEPLGESLEELKEHYKQMAEAFEQPVLEDKDETAEAPFDVCGQDVVE